MYCTFSQLVQTWIWRLVPPLTHSLPQGCHSQWVDVVTGRRWPLRMGYHVVRNPGQAQLVGGGISAAAARAEEARFFAEQQPWAGLAKVGQGAK